MEIYNQIKKSKLFIALFAIGLIAKVLFVIFVNPELQEVYYLPFLTNINLGNFLDPWTTHLKSGGSAADFPFGTAMIITLSPLLILGNLFLETSLVSLKMSYFAADLMTFYFFAKIFSQYLKNILIFYWLSPLVFFITYWHGVTDIIPVFLITSSILFIRTERYYLSGIAMALGISAKFSMIIILPFLFIYLFKRSNYNNLHSFLYSVSIGSFFLNAPILWSSGFLEMAYGISQGMSILNFMLNVSNDLSIFLIPLIYLLLLTIFIFFRSLNFELLVSFMFIAIFLIIHFINPTFGYYLWLVPFISLFSFNSDRIGKTIILIFSFMITGYHLLYSMGADIGIIELQKASIFSDQGSSIFKNLFFTINTFIGFVLAYYFFSLGILQNSYLRFKRDPSIIAIAGDSGAGKDTLADSLREVFGPKQTLMVSGDDYHLWERGAPEWQEFTHLDPKANDLQKFFRDIAQLFDGNTVLNKVYDHETGLFSSTRRFKSNEFIVASGLHALIPNHQILTNLRIFIDTSNNLKLLFKLRRDVNERNHKIEKVLASIESRRPDFKKYIKPQSDFADIIFRLDAIHEIDPIKLISMNKDPELKLEISTKKFFYSELLLRYINQLPNSSMTFDINPLSSTFTFTGSIDKSDLYSIALNLEIDEDIFRLNENSFENDTLGIMQLFTLLFLNEKKD